LNTIVFSALTLEAFINHYAIEKSSLSYLKRHLDNLNPVNKWLIIPKLFTGKELDRNSQAFELLKRLFTRRNKIVHNKTKEIKVKDYQNEAFERPEIMKGYAREALETVRQAVDALKELDKNIDIEWLDNL
jgi:hypothetical protein